MKLLVTGGAGFIGSHVCEYLLEKNHEVVILDDFSGGRYENVPSKARVVEGSIIDYELLKGLFAEEKFDFVYHIAAYAAENLSHFIRRFNYNNNLIGSINLINQSIIHNIKCFVFTSSIAVYGSNQLPMVESLTPHPEDPYGIAKYAIELDLMNAYKNFGLNYIIFRPHNVFGERQNINDRYRNVIGIFMKQLLNEQPLTVFGDGLQTRAFTYINDIIPILGSAVFNKKAYNEVFNIGGEEVMSVKDLAQTICEAMGRKAQINYLESRNEVKHAFAQHQKIKKYFPVSQQTSIKEGIDRMADWVTSNFLYLDPSSKFETEISFGLPQGW